MQQELKEDQQDQEEQVDEKQQQTTTNATGDVKSTDYLGQVCMYI